MPKLKIPRNVVLDTFTQPFYDNYRTRLTKDYRFHVSDIIQTEKSRVFCPRQKVLWFTQPREEMPRRITPGFELLFARGNFLHDYIRDRFADRSPYGHTLYGWWKCRNCKHALPDATLKKVVRKKCPSCKRRNKNKINNIWQNELWEYQELDLEHPSLHIVGHPDMILFKDGKYYLYEIKSIDRADIDFSELDAPLGDHTLQASFYYYLMKIAGYNVSPYIRYIYVDRSNSTLFKGSFVKEFTIKRSPYSRLEPFLKKVAQAGKGIEKRKLPPKICKSITGSRAKECGRAVECFAKRTRNV